MGAVPCQISVIMPVYNAEKFIKEAVESILTQTFKELELIIVDDCGNDHSIEIINNIKDDRIRILQNDKNRGIAYSTNKGLDQSRGKYIALIDDDDISMPYRLEEEFNFLEKNKDIDVVGGDDITINEEGETISYRQQLICNSKRIKADLLFMNRIHNATSMFRTNFVRKNNIRYREDLCGMQDFKFWTECAAYGNLANIDKLFSKWRSHGSNETFNNLKNNKKKREEKYAEIQLESLELQGFQLNDDEKKLYTHVFRESDDYTYSIEELLNTKKILQKIISQAKNKKDDNMKELIFSCKNNWLERTKKCCLWE